MRAWRTLPPGLLVLPVVALVVLVWLVVHTGRSSTDVGSHGDWSDQLLAPSAPVDPSAPSGAPSPAPSESIASSVAASTSAPARPADPASRAATTPAPAGGTAVPQQPGAVAPTTPAGGTPQLYNAKSGLCLSAVTGLDGQELVLASCNGSATERWTFMADGTIRAARRCMDVADARTANGTIIQVADCNGNRAQQWTQDSTGRLASGLVAGKCLDIEGGSTDGGSTAVLWPCGSGGTQLWQRR